jgi:hypothetical protein
MRIRARATALLVSALLGFAPGLPACTGAAPPTPQSAEAPRPKPKTAHLLALQIVQGKVGTMIYMDRLRGRPAAIKLAQAGYLGDLFEGTGVDPMRDLERVFIASTGITDHDRAVIVAQHRLQQAQLREAIDKLVARSTPPGAWLDDLGLPAARITLHGRTRIVAVVDDEYVAVLPEALAAEAKKFLGTGGFPDPDGPESVVTVAQDASHSLRAPRAPHIPDTISTARITLRFQDDGTVDAAGDGESTSAEQAVKDALALTDAVDRATSVKIAILRVRFFKPVPFRAEGSHVKTDVHLSPDEVDKLLGMAELFRRQMR